MYHHRMSETPDDSRDNVPEETGTETGPETPADFAAIVASLRDGSATETVFDDLDAAHALAVGAVQSELAETAAALQAVMQERDELQAMLFQQATETGTPDNEETSDPDVIDPDTISIDDLFA